MSSIKPRFNKYLISAIFIFAFVLFAPKNSFAATLFASPSSGSYPVGQTFSVTIRTNTQGAPVNTAEANITYSTDTLTLVRVTQGSTFYLPAPGSPGKGTGTAYLGGGLPTPGYEGTSGLIGTLTFQAKAVGTGTVSVLNGKVLLNDGLGTNALAGTSGAQFNITPPAVGAIEVVSTTHPDPEKAYNKTTVDLSWNRPANVYGYSFDLDREPDTVPDNTLDTTVTTTKSYSDLTDGTWYFHIKGRRQDASSAFGTTTHFKINIDTTVAPAPVESIPPEAVQKTIWQNLLDTLQKTVAVPLYVILIFNLIFLLIFILVLMLWKRKKDRKETSDPDLKQVQLEIDESLEDLKQEISQKLLGLSAKSSEELFEKETEAAKQLRAGIVKTRKRIDKNIEKIKRRPKKDTSDDILT